MPTQTEEEFFNAVQKKNIDEIRDLIKKSPDLINATHPKLHGRIIHVLFGTKNVGLIKEVVGHEKFDLEFFDTNKRTIRDSVLVYGNVEVVNAALINPKFLLCSKKVAVNATEELINEKKYEEFAVDATESLINDQKSRQIEYIKTNAVRSHEIAAEKIKNYEQIKIILTDAAIEQAKQERDPKSANSPLRCALIRFCIRMDDEVLFNRLEREGLAPTSMITISGNPARPVDLFTDSNVKLPPIFKASVSVSISVLKSSPDSLFNKGQKQQELLKKAEGINTEYNQSKTEREAYRVKRGIDTVEQLIKNSKPGQP